MTCSNQQLAEIMGRIRQERSSWKLESGDYGTRNFERPGTLEDITMGTVTGSMEYTPVVGVSSLFVGARLEWFQESIWFYHVS